MRSHERSWFDRPRWWLALPTTVGAMLLLSWLFHGFTFDSSSPDIGLIATASFGGSLTGNLIRGHRAWQQLEMSTTATAAQLSAAEAVARHGTRPASDVERVEALRIIDLRLERIGGAIAVEGVLGLCVVVTTALAVLQRPGWVVYSAALAAVTLWHRGHRRWLITRRAQLSATQP